MLRGLGGGSGQCPSPSCRRGLGSSRTWELPGFVPLSWQSLGKEGGGEKGGLVADLGNRKILQYTDGHSAWSRRAQRSSQKASGWPWATQESRWERGTLDRHGDCCGLKGKKVWPGLGGLFVCHCQLRGKALPHLLIP